MNTKYSTSQLPTSCMILGWVHAVLLGFGFYPLIASCAGLTGTTYTKFCAIGLLLFIPVILSWLFIRKIKSLFFYISAGVICSLIVAALSFVLGSASEDSQYFAAVATFLLSMTAFITHCVARIRHGEMKADFIASHGSQLPSVLKEWEIPTFLTHPNIACIAWFVLQYCFGLIIRQPGHWRFVFYLTLLDVLTLFAFRYTSDFHTFLQDNRNSASLPVHTIFRVHAFLFFAGLLILLILLIPSVLLNREPLTEISFERKTALIDNSNSGRDEMYLEMVHEDMNLPEIVIEGEVPHIPEWISQLFDAFLVVLTIIFFVFLFLGLLRSARHARERFVSEDEDEIIFLEDAVEEQADKKAAPFDGFFSANMQIRRRYKKIIRKATSGVPDCWATPSELEAHAGLSNTQDIQMLHEAYEKARYSAHGATWEDARRFVH